jgi:hypothetical protein
VTTNYDNFMFDVIIKRNNKKIPRRELCRWSNDLEKILEMKRIKPILGKSYKPSGSEPLVFHLHGYLEIPESIVLTENDYLDFMIRLSDIEHSILPLEVNGALAMNALLFVGYSLADWNFRVLFRSIFNSIQSMTNLIMAVQLRPTDVKNQEDAMRYLGKYFASILGGNIKVRVFWGEATEFARELRKHWEERK